MNERVSLEGAYGLSPMQTGMLFQSLYNPGKGLDIEQLVCEFTDGIDPSALKQAWQQVWQTNRILRTGFEWEELDQPVQHIYSGIQIPWAYYDWSSSSEEPKKKLKDFLFQDRLKGFNLSQPPLMRLTLIQTSNKGFWLIWSFHHILLDGRAIPIIFKQVANVYQAHCQGKIVELQQATPYQSYIHWLEKQDWQPSKVYWKEQLKGIQNPTSLGVNHHQPPLSDGEKDYEKLNSHISPEPTQSLREIAEQHSLTLNTLLQGAWAILLSRYSGEQDIVFGAIRTTRHTILNDGQSINETVGLLINTIPVRIQIDPQLSTLQILQKLRSSTLELRGSLHEHISLADIQQVSDLQPGIKLFESILAFENVETNEALRDQHPMFEKANFELLEHVGYPLVVNSYAGKNQLKICLEYSRVLFDAETAQRILNHLHTLLKGMAEDLTTPVYRLPILTEEETQQLKEWNNTNIVYLPKECIHQQFEIQAQRNPETIALTFEGLQLSYAELAQKSNQLANYLRGQGVGRETIVALYMDRSIEMIIALLAILKAGGAYLPIDPVYPPERIAFILEDSHTPILLTEQDKIPAVQAFPGKILCLNTEWGLVEEQSVIEPENISQPQDLAYVIYTSGSTGKPKGVLVTHYNVIRLFQATDEWYHFGPSDVWTMFHSYAFDFSVWEIWGALLYGGRVVVVPYMVSRSPQTFHQMLIDEGVTVLNQTPSAFYQLIKADENANQINKLKLRFVIFGGEALDLQALRPWFDRHGDQQPQLVNMYGITETTVHVTYRPINYSDVDAGQGSIIGVPIPDLQVYLLDQQKQLCPVGVTGEIYVGGGGVARGYLNRPELTEERFVPNPFDKEGDSRLYKSGDLARRLPNGELVYLGRSDFQVKIRGFRVELGEIETVLSYHPCVQNVLVIARPDSFGSMQLIAYIIPKPEYITRKEELSPASLREILKPRVPAYMIPAVFIILDSFPLTPNGKIDRKALPSATEVDMGTKPSAAPHSQMEKDLLKIWSNVLGIQKIGVQDNFFDLGGHSLLATRLMVRIHSELGIDLPLRTLFEFPTVAELSKQLENLVWVSKQASQKSETGLQEDITL